MLVAKEGHVAMNFIGNHDHPSAVTEVSQFPKGLARPYDSCRIMWIRQYQHAAFVVTYRFQIIKIHRIRAVLIFMERVEDDGMAVTLRHQTERMINRGLDDNLVILLEKRVDCHADTFDNTRDICQPLLLHLPLMMVLNPLHHCRPVLYRFKGITIQGMVQTPSEGICNKVRSLEIHIGDPQGRQIIPTELLLQYVCLDGSCTSTLYEPVKIVFHLHRII